MRVAVYGGSFDPPHVGHAMVAAWLRWTDRVDRVCLVPAYGHAFGKQLVDYDARLAMCRALAATLGPWAEVSEVERGRSPSYTIDTLELLAASRSDDRFRLVVGADILESADRWRAWDRIAEDFTPIVVGRDGYPEVEGAIRFPDVSSTEVRARLRGGEPVAHLVPAAVLELARDLYVREEDPGR